MLKERPGRSYWESLVGLIVTRARPYISLENRWANLYLPT